MASLIPFPSGVHKENESMRIVMATGAMFYITAQPKIPEFDEFLKTVNRVALMYDVPPIRIVQFFNELMENSSELPK